MYIYCIYTHTDCLISITVHYRGLFERIERESELIPETECF